MSFSLATEPKKQVVIRTVLNPKREKDFVNSVAAIGQRRHIQRPSARAKRRRYPPSPFLPHSSRTEEIISQSFTDHDAPITTHRLTAPPIRRVIEGKTYLFNLRSLLL